MRNRKENKIKCLKYEMEKNKLRTRKIMRSIRNERKKNKKNDSGLLV